MPYADRLNEDIEVDDLVVQTHQVFPDVFEVKLQLKRHLEQNAVTFDLLERGLDHGATVFGGTFHTSCFIVLLETGFIDLKDLPNPKNKLVLDPEG